MKTIDDKIYICNWLLTRRCNLACSYCAISMDYIGKPLLYPDLKYYIENEMSTETAIEILTLLKKHNPEMFHIFYGGEPFLRKDLHEIINFCNDNNIFYTIISNCSPQIEPLIDSFFKKVKYIQGFTASVDPYYDRENSTDQAKKTSFGKQKLLQYKGIVKDLVAEITVSNFNKEYLYDLVCELSESGITSDITFLDIAKNEYYDFSNVKDKKEFVHFDNELLMIFSSLVRNKNLKIHMSELFPKILSSLPSNYDCKLEDNFNNLTIDADGVIRTCLRIRGSLNYNVTSSFDENGKIFECVKIISATNKRRHCKLCNWPCMMMSELLRKNESTVSSLVHFEDRK